MSEDLFLDLGWLPRAPDDYNASLKALNGRSVEAQDEGLGQELRRLASVALDEAKLAKLGAAVTRALQAGADLRPLAPLKLAIVSNATTDLLATALVGTAIRFGFALTVVSAPFGQVIQDALDPASAINRFGPDLVLCAIDHRGLPLQPVPGSSEAMRQSVDAAIGYLEAIRGGIERNSGAICIFQTIARPVETLFGSLDIAVPGTWRSLVELFNRQLVQSLSGTAHLRLDAAGVAETVGLGRWHDPALWNLAKIPFATAALPLYADHVGRLIGAWRGKARRCLVLDLDNTVWGGIIGDDGLDNILVAEVDATGEAHLDVQRTALALRERGIVLAVSSKNDDEVACGPFRHHAEMLLRENHIAVFQANWHDKATNVTPISQELALGLESIAFLDDNPVERNLIISARSTWRSSSSRSRARRARGSRS